MSPDIVKKMEQLSEEIIHKLEEFIRNEQAFSQDFNISSTEPLLQLEDLLDYCRSYLPHHLDLIERTEQERNQLFEWSHIANKINNAEAKGKTKGFAMRLVKKLQHISEIVRDELASEKLTGTGPDIAPAKDKKKKAKIAYLFKKIIGWIFKKTSHVIGAVIIAIIGGLIVAILFDIFADFGWVERIKAVIYKILQLN